MKDTRFAICQTAFSQMRPEPSQRSELISQLRLGEPVRVLEWQGNWALIETEHAYQGFVRSAQLQPVEENRLQDFVGILGMEEATRAGFPFSAGAFGWKQIGLALNEVFLFPDIPPTGAEFGKKISDLAAQFLQVPYVWGGKTQWGLDCSGLVQLVLNLMGYSFPRDAWQQAARGMDIPFEPSEPEFHPGDLLFFREEGKTVHHVALSTGGSEFIHSSEWVRINSLSQKSEDFAEDRLKTLCLARRLSGSSLVKVSTSVAELFNQNK